MVIVMKAGAEQQDIDAVIARIREFNYQPHPIQGTERAVITAIGRRFQCAYGQPEALIFALRFMHHTFRSCYLP